jgi:outer membrane protein assembly factor BamA
MWRQPVKAISICLLLFFNCTSYSAIASLDSTLTHGIADTLNTDPHRLDEIIIIGNKQTKTSVVLRELTFHKGDSLMPLQFDKVFRRSEENLMNTSLFNSVHISALLNSSNTMTVYIIVTERWYIFPIPIFELVDRNFNVWWRTKDFSKINYGGVLTWNNFRGRNETVGITLRLGYTQRVSFFYSIPFITKKQKSGLSFAFAYSRNHETAYRNFQNDLLYFKNENFFSRKEIGASVQYAYRRNLYQSHFGELSWHRIDVADTIVRLNPEFFSNGSLKERYTGVRYFFKIEHRDLVAYPLKGSYFDLEVNKAGLPFLKDDIDVTYITSTVKKYWQLNRRFFFAASVRGKTTINDAPYYNTRALGFGTDYLRGYEYYVVDGQQFALFKTNLKFQVLAPHSIRLKYIPLEKFATIPYAFYLNLYSDAAYVDDHQFSLYNSLTNTWMYSGGIGIDFVTYYDLVFRLEYSVNKFGESGIFLHFSAPI